MPRDVPASDFRSIRRYLTSDDYALPADIEYVPRGLIEPAIWTGLTLSTDTVLLETTDDKPIEVAAAYNLTSRLLDIAGELAPEPEKGGPLHYQIVVAFEDLESALYNAASGWYRTAGLCLRTAFDDVLLGLYFELFDRNSERFEAVTTGNARTPSVREILRRLHATTGRNEYSPDGQVIRLYDELSVYQHRLSNFELVQSTAAVYRSDVFERWAKEMATLLDLVSTLTAGLRSVAL